MRTLLTTGLLFATLGLLCAGPRGTLPLKGGPGEKRLPANFWILPPREAALAFLRHHVFQDQESLLLWAPSAVPPPSGQFTLSLTVHSPRSNPPGFLACYLRAADPAYCAASGLSFYGFARASLDPAEARHLAEVVYWIGQVRSRRPSSPQADPFTDRFPYFHEPMELILRGPDGNILLDLRGTSRANPRLFQEGYTAAVAAAAAQYLLQDTLNPALSTSPRQDSHELARTFLALASTDEKEISMPLATRACGSLDHAAILANRPQLERIARLAPPASPALPSYQELQRALSEIPHTEEPRQRAQHSARRAELTRLIDNVESGVSSRDPRFLTRAASFALERAKVDNDPAALAQWAASGRYGDGWAFRRLSEIAPDLAVDKLESQLAAAGPSEAEYLYERIRNLSRERARALLDKPGMPFTVRLEAVLQMPGGDARDDALVTLLPDYHGTARQARTIIESLVPQDTPHQCSHPRLNAALLKVVTPDRSRRNPDLVSWAATACALRGHTVVLDEIERVLRSRSDKNTAGLLNAWILLSSQQSNDARARLLDYLRSELQTTAHSVNTLLWAVWAANLTELRPEIERLAAPEDAPAQVETRPAASPAVVRGPYDLARKILAVWTETDPATRFRKLVQLAGSENFPPPDYQHEAGTRRLREELQAAFAQIPRDQIPVLREQVRFAGTPPTAFRMQETVKIALATLEAK